MKRTFSLIIYPVCYPALLESYVSINSHFCLSLLCWNTTFYRNTWYETYEIKRHYLDYTNNSRSLNKITSELLLKSCIAVPIIAPMFYHWSHQIYIGAEITVICVSCLHSEVNIIKTHHIVSLSYSLYIFYSLMIIWLLDLPEIYKIPILAV